LTVTSDLVRWATSEAAPTIASGIRAITSHGNVQAGLSRAIKYEVSHLPGMRFCAVCLHLLVDAALPRRRDSTNRSLGQSRKLRIRVSVWWVASWYWLGELWSDDRAVSAELIGSGDLDRGSYCAYRSNGQQNRRKPSKFHVHVPLFRVLENRTVVRVLFRYRAIAWCQVVHLVDR
jgi:hypothetical protein